MLTEIRDRSSGWFAWIIAALIIIPMAFWGVQEYATTEAMPTLVEVGEQKITQNEYQAQLSNQQARQREAMGDQVNNELLNSSFFKDSVLQQMINRALVDQIAADNNYRIGDEQLAEFIKQSPIFQADGEFDQTAYDRYVVSSQYSKTQFENRIRDDNRVSQVMAGYQESAFVLPDEVRALLEIQAEKRSFDVLSVRKQDYLADVEVSEQEIDDYYQAQQSQFMQPERVSVSYLELDINNLLLDVQVDEEELEAIYEQNAESYVSDEKRQTRHILLTPSDEVSDDQQKAKAEDLVAQLRNGADFAELAKTHSDDPGSGAQGGDLGLVERGQMVEEFEQATFELEEGAISEPVKTQFGYHIIQVQAVQASQQQPYAEVRFDLEQEEKQRLAEELLIEKLDQMRDLAFEQSDNLDGVAEELSLTVQKTELFDRITGSDIASSQAVRNAAFSDDVLFEERNSEPVEVSEGRHVVLRKLAHQESIPQPLESVAEQIKALVSSDKASEAAKQAGEKALEKAQLSWPSLLEQVGQDDNLNLVSHTIALADNDRSVAPEIMRLVSSMRLDDGQAVVDSTTGTNGDFHIVRLSAIEPGDLASISQQVKDSTRRLIEQRNGQSLVGSYLESLRTELNPVVNQDLL